MVCDKMQAKPPDSFSRDLAVPRSADRTLMDSSQLGLNTTSRWKHTCCGHWGPKIK